MFFFCSPSTRSLKIEDYSMRLLKVNNSWKWLVFKNYDVILILKRNSSCRENKFQSFIVCNIYLLTLGIDFFFLLKNNFKCQYNVCKCVIFNSCSDSHTICQWFGPQDHSGGFQVCPSQCLHPVSRLSWIYYYRRTNYFQDQP